MSDLLERIRMAQVAAREEAVSRGARSPAEIYMAGVHAAEQLVIANLHRKIAAAKAQRDGSNIIPLPKR